MKPLLITGGAGFFGGILKNRLLRAGLPVVSIDLNPDTATHSQLTSIRGDIRDRRLMEELFEKHHFETIYHCAAILAHAVTDRDFLWTSNVDGTRIIADCAKRFGARSLIFTSSNCLWGHSFSKPVDESEPPAPVEIYGHSKWEAEKILGKYQNDLNIGIIRCPTILDEGRLGLLAILFEFIREGRKLWVVGGGNNRYQFIYAQDLVDACLRCAQSNASHLFHVGSDDVKPFKDVYEYVIQHAGTGSRVASLPKAPALMAMKLAYWLGLSPLGPYQYKMIAENFVFATDKIKTELGWEPSLKNEEMLWLTYKYYATNLADIRQRKDASAHRQAAPMGIIRLLKWLS